MMIDSPQPNDSKLLLFSWVVSICKTIIPARMRSRAGAVLFSITPGIPVSLKSILPEGWPRRAFFYGVIIGWVFCFGVIYVWTNAAGTYQGDDPRRLYFREDIPDIINYLILCPLYIGLGAALIVLASQSWVNTYSDSRLSVPGKKRSPRLPLGVVFIIIIGLSTLLTCNYIRECLDPNIYERAGWYIARIDNNGQRIIGLLGIYYSLLTYSLFLIVFFATFSLFLFFATAAETSRALRDPDTAPLSVEALRDSLSHFMSAYIVAKCFAGVLMLNAFTWRALQHRHSFNLIAMGTALTIGGVFLISVPRYYIELKWYELCVARARLLNQEVPTESQDLRPRYKRLLAFLLDLLLFSGFISSFWFEGHC